MWGIPIISGSSKSLSNQISNHFYIITDWDWSEHETFYFSSQHLQDICISHPDIAFYRGKAFLRILNGMRMLKNSPPVIFDSNSIYYFKDYGKRSIIPIRENPQIEYEELQNPFLDERALNKITGGKTPKSYRDGVYEVDLFWLSYKEDLVREVLTLFSLLKIEPLYFLVNASKIVETIEFDLGLQIVGKMKSIDKKKLKQEILSGLAIYLKEDSKHFLDAYDFFRKGNFFSFINNREGSGLFSRHGATSNNYDKKLPKISFNEIEYNIQVLIYEWINYKLIKLKGYRYPPIEKAPQIFSLNNEDFNFDL